MNREATIRSGEGEFLPLTLPHLLKPEGGVSNDTMGVIFG
jgi:hypothetical protein